MEPNESQMEFIIADILTSKLTKRETLSSSIQSTTDLVLKQPQPITIFSKAESATLLSSLLEQT